MNTDRHSTRHLTAASLEITPRSVNDISHTYFITIPCCFIFRWYWYFKMPHSQWNKFACHVLELLTLLFELIADLRFQVLKSSDSLLISCFKLFIVWIHWWSAVLSCWKFRLGISSYLFASMSVKAILVNKYRPCYLWHSIHWCLKWASFFAVV